MHKAKERYEQTVLDEKIKERSLDLTWQHRYVFATVLHDPILDRLIDHLPERTEISEKLQELLYDRLLEVRLRLQHWNLLEYVRYRPVEQALYDLNDMCSTQAGKARYLATIEHTCNELFAGISSKGMK